MLCSLPTSTSRLACKHSRALLRPQPPSLVLRHRLQQLLRVPRAQPEGDDEPQQDEEKKEGTLSNRYKKMVEELQKAGLTPAKAKVGPGCVCVCVCVSIVCAQARHLSSEWTPACNEGVRRYGGAGTSQLLLP